MPKIHILLRARRPTDHAAFARRASALVPGLLARDPLGLKLAVTASAPPRLSMVPLARAPLASISIWTSRDEALEPWARAAAIDGAEVAAYRVEEAIPLTHARTWPDGEPTPGVGLLTLFRRRRGLSDDALRRRWHGGHTPLALEVHPLVGYVRDTVTAAHGAPLDAIVGEHLGARGDLLRPHRFFGGPLRMIPNMLRIGRDIAGFIDLASLESFLVEERWIRSPR